MKFTAIASLISREFRAGCIGRSHREINVDKELTNNLDDSTVHREPVARYFSTKANFWTVVYTQEEGTLEKIFKIVCPDFGKDFVNRWVICLKKIQP